MDKKKTTHYVNNNELYRVLCIWKAQWTQWQEECETLKTRKRPKSEWPQKPPLPDYVAECLVKIARHLSYKPNFINYCVDAETEALTRRGWLHWDEITEQDEVLSCDPSDSQMKWSTLKSIFRNKEFEGDMYHATGNGLDALVTYNHRFLTPERGLVKIQHLKVHDHITLMGAPLEDAKTMYSDAFVELVGWSVTEGNYRIGKHCHGILIAQKKQPGVSRIEACLTASGAIWKKSPVKSNDGLFTFSVTGPVANEVVRLAPHRVLSSEFMANLTQVQRLLLIDTMIMGDGWQNVYYKPAGNLRRHYSQKDKAHVDAFLSLCAQAGIRTSYRWRTDLRTPDGKPTAGYSINLCEGSNECAVEYVDLHGAASDLRHSYHMRGSKHPQAKLTDASVQEAKVLHATAGATFSELSEIYGVNRAVIHRAVTGQSWKHLSGEPIQKEHHATVPHKGVVWCPETHYGTFVCRRGGKVFVTGNTFKEDMIGDALENCLLYIHNFRPERSTNAFAYVTQIMHNAFIRRIQKESKQLYVKMKVIEQADMVGSYGRQQHDEKSYDNNYVAYLQENMGDVIQNFEERKKRKKKARAQANLDAFFVGNEKEEMKTSAK